MRSEMGMMLVVLGSMVFAACDPLPEWQEQSDYSVTMGYGWDEFTSYDELGELQLQRGFQGGQHLNASLRATGVQDLNGLVCTLWVVDPTAAEEEQVVIEPHITECEFMTVGEMFAYQTVPEGMDPDTAFMPNLSIYVESPSAVLDRNLELRVEVVSPGGETGRAWYNGDVTWMPEPEFDDI